MHKQFVLVAGAGHCGSTWVANVAADQRNWIGHHELRYYLSNKAWFNAAAEPPVTKYWEQINMELTTLNVLDSNSWAPFEIPMVDKVIPVTKVIYLIRNGIQQLHSIKTKSAAYQNLPDESFTIGTWLRTWWDIGEAGSYDGTTRFEKLCTLINAHSYMPNWLRTKGFDVAVLRFEDLISDVNFAAEVFNLSKEALLLWQRKDVNRKVNGDRRPETLWASWTDEERDIFYRRCGQTMRESSYWKGNGYDRKG